ncbi:MAG: putative ABC exporter domain-containing protein [Vicinamibacterales bacterium]
MIATLASLSLWQIKNRIRVRIARLREPRYLVGSIVGIAYLAYFAVLRNPSFSAGRGASAIGNLARAAGPVELGLAATLLVLATLVWLLPANPNPVRFSASEVQFLFPAPITRRQLLQYRLLRAQLGLLFGSVMATVFMRPTSLANGWKFLTGLWLILMTCRIYFTGVSLYRESVRQRGSGGMAKWAPVIVACGAVAIVAAAVAASWPSLNALNSPGEVFEELDRIASGGAVGLILWPFRALTRLPLAATATAYWAALPGALAVLLVNYLWVLKADTAFEENAALVAEKNAARPRARVQPRVRAAATTPFVLAPTGRVETAIVWKNLIMIGRYASLRTLLRLVPAMIGVGVVVSIVGRRSGMAAVAAGACLILLAMTILIGPMLSRNDLRRDLANLAMLKAWPISGATLLRGEILAPGVVLTSMAWLLILGATALVGNLDVRAVAPLILQRLSYMTAALMVAPAVILAELTVLNGLAVLFPAWISTGATRSRGVDALGQRLFTTAGVLITLVVALVPAGIVAALVAAGVYLVTGVVPVILPAAIVACLVIVECIVVIELLGRVLDRTDVSAVSPAE